MRLPEEPADDVIEPLDRVMVTVTREGEPATGQVVAEGRGAAIAKDVIVQGPGGAPSVVLPDALWLSGESIPFSEPDPEIGVTLPADPGRQPGPACADDGSLVGRIGGPDGLAADVCIDGPLLSIGGADRAGTWSGTVDVVPSDPDVGSIDLTVTVRDFWILPLLVLLVGLVVALRVPMREGRRSRLLLRFHIATELERVSTAHDSAREAIGRLAGGATIEIDRVHDPNAPLYLDREAAGLVAGLDRSADGKSRAQYAPPDGVRYTSFQGLVERVQSHYGRLVNIAARAARLRRDILGRFASLPVDRSFIVTTALRPAGLRLVDAHEFDAAARRLDAVRSLLERFEALWARIRRLREGAEAVTVSLLTASDDEGLKAAEAAVRAAEKDQEVPVEIPVERLPTPEWPGATLPPPRRRSRLWWVALALVPLILAGVIVVSLDLFTAGSGSFGDTGSDQRILVTTVAVVAIAVMAGLVALVARRRSRARPEPDAASVRAQLKRLDRQIAWLGGTIVLVTGFVVLYLQNTTFGGLADYIAAATWGFTLGIGVNIAKRIIPSKALEAIL
jgi:cytochrome c-type biogenesis protein CcmH/NrfF